MCATGPRTPEGKRRSAENLEGYPTAEQRLRTRYNGLKTGLHARTISVLPANPGMYPICNQCDVGAEACAQEEHCMLLLARTWSTMQAYEKGDAKALLAHNAKL
ncbi:hypothetical protein [Magnetofaba australis]|uniref:hypothetical protein n=1 Tax=Magnetofaba australis TaxID=1472297 RepID=UPI000A19F132|nr:hypothetical protein [Magnetofaba australis]